MTTLHSGIKGYSSMKCPVKDEISDDLGIPNAKYKYFVYKKRSIRNTIQEIIIQYNTRKQVQILE